MKKMDIPKACRICLVTGVKLFQYDRYKLKNYYEEIMASKINNKVHLPHHFCYECAALLHKFHKFKEKCYRGKKILEELMHKGPITLNSIKNIDRRTENLQSSFKILTVNHRVRTYITKSKQTTKVQIPPSSIEVDTETESSNGDDCNKDKSDEKEELASLPEQVEVDTKVEDVEVSDKNIDVCDERFDILEEKIWPTDNLLQEKPLNDNETSSSDDENIFNDVDIPENDDKPTKKEPHIIVEEKEIRSKGSEKKNKRKNGETVKKAKRFEITNKKRTDLDPNNWLKINLSEEEAVEEFRARAQHKPFISAKYKCNDCIKGFSKEDMLNRHIKLRHGESVGPIECRFCHMRFKWQCFLRKHMRQHYTKYKCLRCDLVCPLETTALFHEDYHNGVIRKCAHCNEEFKHMTTYYTHLRTHRSEHVCTLCGASFVSAMGLRIHKRIKHINAESKAAESSEAGEECKKCNIKFETRKAYEEHFIQSAMHDDGVEDLVRCQRRKHNRKFRKIPTDCHICGKHFATQLACRKHHLAEHPRMSFFAPNERQICEICGISLAPGSVSSHLNTHTREKMYACDTCGKQFNSKGGMMTHQLTHTSEKPVPCTLCDKRFKQISSMRLHYRTFHLKEPYPKRNRKKKTEEISKLDDYPQEGSDENLAIDRWR